MLCAEAPRGNPQRQCFHFHHNVAPLLALVVVGCCCLCWHDLGDNQSSPTTPYLCRCPTTGLSPTHLLCPPKPGRTSRERSTFVP